MFGYLDRSEDHRQPFPGPSSSVCDEHTQAKVSRSALLVRRISTLLPDCIWGLHQRSHGRRLLVSSDVVLTNGGASKCGGVRKGATERLELCLFLGASRHERKASDGGPPGFVTCDRLEKLPTHQSLLENFPEVFGGGNRGRSWPPGPLESCPS